ncbi:MAG: HlyD family type I secretion periplasmic adaptor subunit, partial [Pseudolabrys sp.]
SVVVDSNVKKVQHPTGGVVGKLNVQDGDRVKAGDILVQLDDTVTRANLAIVTKGLDELAARKARLEAERDGAESVTFPRMLLAHAEDAPVAIAIANERKLFELRRTARLGQKAQLRQRITQLQDEISGQTAQQEAKAREITLIGKELEGVRELWKNNLVQITRLTALERDAARLEGERAQLIAAVAQTKGKISETELQIIQIDSDLSSEVAKDMREVDAKYGEFVERKVAAEDQLKRIDIRAPQDGVVLESKVHTVGGVISAGDAIMLIVPESDNLQVEAKINPRDIDQIQVGQPAMLRFSAFNLRTTPEINGTITRIAADATADQRTGQTYYNTRIAMTKGEIARLGEVKLIPGMPVEAFVQTGERSVMSYLIKPLQDQFMRAFREK